MAAHVEVPGQQGRGQLIGAAAGTLDQDGPAHQRLAWLVAPEHDRLGQPELPGDVPAESPAHQCGVFVSHGIPLVGFKNGDDALAAGGADGNESAGRAAVDVARGVQHFRERGDNASAGGSEGVAGCEGGTVDVEL